MGVLDEESDVMPPPEFTAGQPDLVGEHICESTYRFREIPLQLHSCIGSADLWSFHFHMSPSIVTRDVDRGCFEISLLVLSITINHKHSLLPSPTATAILPLRAKTGHHWPTTSMSYNRWLLFMIVITRIRTLWTSN